MITIEEAKKSLKFKEALIGEGKLRKLGLARVVAVENRFMPKCKYIYLR